MPLEWHSARRLAVLAISRKAGTMERARVFLLQRLEAFFQRIEESAGAWRERCAVCPDCGANRYAGKPCITFGAPEVTK